MEQQSNLPKKILLIEDDTTIAEAVTSFLKKHNIAVVRALDIETAMYQFNQQLFEIVVVELEFSSLPGLAVVQKIRGNPAEERRSAGIVITSGQQRKSQDDGLMHELGDMEIIQKPLTDIKMLPALARALQRKRGLKEYELIRSVCYDMVQKKNDLGGAINLLKQNLPKIGQRGISLMAHLYEESGQVQDALKTVDTLLSKNPDDIAMLNSKGRLLLKMGDAGKARELLEKADRLAPQNIERIRNMASMYLKLQDPKASTAKMKELIALSPENKDLKFDLFRDLETAGYVEAAIGLCRETTLPAEVVRFYNNKGVMLSKTGDNKMALAEYTSALRFYPTFTENYRIHFNIAIAEANQKSIESLQRAESALHKCLELSPNFDKGVQLLAQVQRMIAHLRKAG